MRNIPFASARSLVSPPAEDLKVWAGHYIPAGANYIVFVNSVPSPFMLGGSPITEFVFSFSRYGSHDAISISVVDYSETQRLVVMVSAGPKDFDTVRQAAFASLFNWRTEK